MDVSSLPFEMKQVQLGNAAFEGNNNCYVIGTEPNATLTLVDTGIGLPDTRDHLVSGLADHGIAFADVEQILLTHWHGDHAGLAGAIQAESGCDVYVHEADAPLVAQEPDALAARDDSLRGLVDDWGMPDEKQAELFDFMDFGSRDDEPPAVTSFADGKRFSTGVTDLEAIHLPGHSEGLTGFAFDGHEGEELFSGDALLPYYTPNVGGADTRVESPLAKYLDTLAEIVDRGYTRAWPGHRGAIIDPSGRAADIVVHHRERTERVLDVLRTHGACDPWTVSKHLFGSLHSIHILHGPGEAYAHLQHLEDAGIVARAGDDYDLVAENPDVDPLFPDVSRALDPDAVAGR